MSECTGEPTNLLYVASAAGNLEAVKQLLNNGASANSEAKNKKGTLKTPLLAAAKQGHMEVVALLLDSGATLSSKSNTQGKTAIHYAARGHREIVQLLLDRGADVNTQSNCGSGPIMNACYHGKLDVVKLLVEKGADINATNSDGHYPLFVASYGGRLEVVQYLLQQGARTTSDNPAGNNPIDTAAQEGYLEIVKLLLAYGAAATIFGVLHSIAKKHEEIATILIAANPTLINMVGDGDYTPLRATAKYGCTKVAQFLLDRGAFVDLSDKSFLTALSLASANGHPSIVELLLDKGAEPLGIIGGAAPIHAAAQEGCVDVAKILIARTACLELKNDKGYTPLMYAATFGKAELAKVMLDAGARIDAKSSAGLTSLACAAQNGHVDVIKLLLNAGANVDLETLKGNTAITFAAERGHVDAVIALVEHGVSVDKAAGRGNTPLRSACSKGQVEVVKALLDRGASLQPVAAVTAAKQGHYEVVKLLLERGLVVDDEVQSAFCTALIKASCYKNLAFAELLINNGADVNFVNDEDCTPIIYAAGVGDVAMVKMLLDKGAFVDCMSNGCTPLDIAAQDQHFGVVELLAERSKKLGQGGKTALLQSLKAGKMDTAALLLKLHPQLASKTTQALHLAVASTDPSSLHVLKLLLVNKSPVNYVNYDEITGAHSTALHMAVISKQIPKVWHLVRRGASTFIVENLHVKDNNDARSATSSVWELCDNDPIMRDVLLQFWTPQTHYLHPKWVKDAIVCVLLIAKRQQWPFDPPLMLKIISHVAFGWLKSEKVMKLEQLVQKKRRQKRRRIAIS